MACNPVPEMNASLGLPSRVEVLGVLVDPWDMQQTLRAADWLISDSRFAHLIGVNADKLLQMRDDAWMDACVRGCELVNADGASMVMAARKLGVEIPERVAGIDLMQQLCELAECKGYRIFLLGAKREVVERARDMLLEKRPNLIIAGIRDGYFGEGEFDAVAEQVQESDAQITFVGITSPKKERLIERFRDLGLTGTFVGVGGSFDVISGSIPRAPMWMQKANLEWAFRMAQEPGRLVKRYLVGNVRFLRLLRAEEKRLKGEGRRA